MKWLEELIQITARLRAPDGCDWDKKQTFISMREHLIEETYEVIDAIDREDKDSLREELGDLLFLVFFLSQLAAEQNQFTIDDVAKDISEKLVRRHPHVFGDTKVNGVDDILKNWEKIKDSEDSGKKKSIIKDLTYLPALKRAMKVQFKASLVGFDWTGQTRQLEILSKVREEFEELESEIRKQDTTGEDGHLSIELELGDLLFSMVNLARVLNADAELSLQKSVDKFLLRFRKMEVSIEEEQKEMKALSTDEWESYWQKAKVNGNS